MAGAGEEAALAVLAPVGFQQLRDIGFTKVSLASQKDRQ